MVVTIFQNQFLLQLVLLQTNNILALSSVHTIPIIKYIFKSLDPLTLLIVHHTYLFFRVEEFLLNLDSLTYVITSKFVWYVQRLVYLILI